jgi:hypothetical protein
MNYTFKKWRSEAAVKPHTSSYTGCVLVLCAVAGIRDASVVLPPRGSSPCFLVSLVGQPWRRFVMPASSSFSSFSRRSPSPGRRRFLLARCRFPRFPPLLSSFPVVSYLISYLLPHLYMPLSCINTRVLPKSLHKCIWDKPHHPKKGKNNHTAVGAGAHLDY